MKENLDYKIKIDIPNITELISETFDGVLDYMFPGMLVFGGALRDIIAGFGLHHDLDIAASHSEGKKFIQYLETSSKWVEECVVDQYKRQAKIMEDKILDVVSPHNMENGTLDLNRNLPCITKPKSSNYGNIQGVRTFINSSGQKLQIIIGKSNLFTLKEQSPILIVKAVDFICCGIMMDIEGNVYEIVEGAKDDCVKKILRINKNADIKFHDLNKRIKKLTNRGWKSEINLAQIRHKQGRLEKIAKRKIDEYSPNNIIQKHTLSNGITQIVINTSKMRIFRHCNNSATKILELFYSIFENHDLTRAIHNCGVNVSYDNYNHTIISIIGKSMETITKLKKALLYQEYKFLPKYGQEYEVGLLEPKKKEKSCFSGKITKFVSQSFEAIDPFETRKSVSASKAFSYYPSSLTWDTNISSNSATTALSACTLNRMGRYGEIEWTGVEKGNLETSFGEKAKLRKKKLAVLKEEKLIGKHNHTDLRSKKVSTPLKTNNDGLINKIELTEDCSNLKITKEEKMRVEYGTNLIDDPGQHQEITKIEMVTKTETDRNNKLSKHFTERQIKSLNTREKEILARYTISARKQLESLNAEEKEALVKHLTSKL